MMDIMVEFLVQTNLKKHQLKINQINSHYIERKFNILDHFYVHVCRSSSSLVVFPRANSTDDYNEECSDPLSNSVCHKCRENRRKVNGGKSPGDDAQTLPKLSFAKLGDLWRATVSREYCKQY